MYDFAHCLSDYIEGITHSICTLEFEVHRPLYDWILESLDLPRPAAASIRIRPAQPRLHRHEQAQAHAARERKARLPAGTTRACRPSPASAAAASRRTALRDFAYNIGITKYNGITDVAVLEHAIREDLNKRALRRLAVLRPIKVVITNYPEGKTEELDAVNNPEDPRAPARARFRSAANCTSSRTISRKCRRRNSSG